MRPIDAECLNSYNMEDGMTGKKMLLFFVSFVVLLMGAVGITHADSNELAAIRAALHTHSGKWVAGETEISKLPVHERALRTGLIKPLATGREQMIAAAGPLQAYALSPSLDWRNYGGNNYVTPVRNQGNCGSCWAFATTAALESFWLISHNTPNTDVNLAEQVLVSCAGAGSCGGGYIDRASNYVRDTGLPPESYYPYTQTNGVCSSALPGWQQVTDKTQGWGWVTTSSVTVDALKNALATYGPLITTMEVYNDFFYYTGGVYHYTSGSLAGGHAVLLVGYDDNAQAFIVKNSWGSGWGEQGYFRIGYSEISTSVMFGQYTIANTNAAPPPPPPPTCTFSITPTSANAPATAGAGSLTVNASAGTCTWTASSNASWLSVSPASGTGSKTVSYTVTQNSGAARNGTATIAGKTFTVNQAASAPSCTFSINPTGATVGASASSGSVVLSASASTCAWTASSNASWLSVSPASGTGSKTVSYTVTQNSGAARNGTATIAGMTFTVNQSGAAGTPTISIYPASLNFGNVPVGWGLRKLVTISNTGSAPLTVSVALTGQSASSFSQTNNCSSVAPNGYCTASVIFWAMNTGSKYATLSISSNDPAHPTTNISLSGTGY